jgi:hypothetical protein
VGRLTDGAVGPVCFSTQLQAGRGTPLHLLASPGHIWPLLPISVPALLERSPSNSRLAPPILGAQLGMLTHIYIANQTQTGPKGCGSNLCLKAMLNQRHKSEPGPEEPARRPSGSGFRLNL